MTRPDVRFNVNSGCEIMNNSLGIQKMPDGYMLMLNDDRSHFFWMEESTGRESAIHWNKWSVYRDAKRDAARKKRQE